MDFQDNSIETSHFIGPVINNAKELGSLDTTTVWALMALVSVMYIFYMARQSNKMQEVRLQEAIAMSKLADSVALMAEKIGQLQITILQQRIGGNEHV